MPVVSAIAPAAVDDRPLDRLVFDACRRHAGAEAIVDLGSGTTHSYDRVAAQCRAVAVGWHAAGLRKGDTVALLLPNCAEFLLCYVGAVCRGGLCAGLNPAFGAYELAHYLASAKYVVTSAGKLPALDEAIATLERSCVLCIYTIDQCDMSNGQESNVPVHHYRRLQGNPDHFDDLPAVHISTRTDPVYMPYSSGTTGLPKGVLLSHYYMTTALAQLVDDAYIPLKHGEYLVTMAPMYHMFGMLSALKHITTGVTIVLLPKFDVMQFFSAVQRYRCRQLVVVPPVLLLMAKHAALDALDLACVTSVWCSAAPVGEALVGDVRRRFPHVRHVLQCYGMTELGNTHAQCLLAGGVHTAAGSIGPPLPSFEAKVVDGRTGAELAAGERGEMHVRSPAPMLGYCAAAGGAHVDQAGWLHTGDLCWRDEHGNFYIVGRLKELVKVSGLQVAPAEIEALLLADARVAQAAVVAVPHARKGQVPRAYVVPSARVDRMRAAERKALADDLVQLVKDKLAAYKQLRGGVLLIDDIPKLASGKVRRNALCRCDAAAVNAKL